MIYTLIGKAVVRGAAIFLRRKYGRAMLPKPLVAGGAVAVSVAVLVALSRRDASAD